MASNKKAQATTTDRKQDGLPRGGTVKLETIYGMESSKTGSIGFGGKVQDAEGRRYQVQAWLIGSKTS